MNYTQRLADNYISPGMGGEMSSRQIVGIGNLEAQQLFMKERRKYLDEWAFLEAIIERVFLNRTIHPPSDEVRQKVAHLPDDDPEVMAIEDKYRTDLIVYTLGRMAVDDLSELTLLAGNGWGIGALKILRGMYERIVTSAYIAKSPQASRAFWDGFWTQRLKLWNRLTAADPAIVQRATPEVVEEIKTEAKRVQERKNASVCKLCGQIKLIDAWTPLDLASMAKIVGKSLEDQYGYCYLDPTSHTHATASGMFARMEHTDDAWLYRLDTRAEARVALTLGHKLLLRNLLIQNEYFSLGLDDSIRQRVDAFDQVWNDHGAPMSNEIQG